MFSRKTKVHLALFLVLAVVGIGYTGGRYAGLDRLFGGSGYSVTVQLADSGGLFTNSEVTYRGVAVGRVTAMRLTETGLEAELHIEDSAPQIPADTRAVVANRSAVGEQYLDLRPEHDGGPYLASGAVVAQDRTAVPLPPESLLVDLDRLVGSVPVDDLRTVVDEVGTAFEGSGAHLQRLLDATSSVTAAAEQHLPQTTSLLANSDVVLRTQQQQAEEIVSFSEGLREISGQLKESDPDLRGIIRDAPAAGQEVQALLDSAGTDFGVVAANMLTTMKITEVRTEGMEQLLVALPVISAFSHTLSPDGTGHLGLVLNFFNPIACTRGYEGTPRRPGSETAPGPINEDLRCAEPPGSVISVRGSQNAPRQPIPDPVPAPPPFNR
ncbi:phospholipid/cholesterol/gamma-HCH transport system substrate-binding protein [Saccharopolyspora kobensis]|uniref:Phospholipid/cholesterol/gamma-HCH transport system substrate-binding protein n=1 Tax=Saccharopolyspora kobensis TaxID=146035 RepID=A0A1H6EI02_9PSEU|nr:MCE family protein [Saccharopolyspora kobensis]SEG96465.1 phospholipid/cholesterol/gamma-HCH transport system substrate-binding protein [Saccharopolyspora kobensis]SFF07426.1 phospholipid/cholesterol/gamma-HCH transport system substrate-binding protein [Saccharopolyspora kobensis]